MGELDAILDSGTALIILTAIYYLHRAMMNPPITLFPVQCSIAYALREQQQCFNAVQLAYLLASMWIQHP